MKIFSKMYNLYLKKILRSLGVRVGLCLKLCLIFQEIYPKYAYNRYAYKKKLVYIRDHNHLNPCIFLFIVVRKDNFHPCFSS